MVQRLRFNQRLCGGAGRKFPDVISILLLTLYQALGFDRDAAKEALNAASGNLELAIDLLSS